MDAKWKQRLRSGGILVLAFFAFLVMLRFFEKSLVYFPSKGMIGAASDLRRPFEEVSLQAADGVELNGWFFPADPGSPRARSAILYCNGNAGNISYRLGVYELLLETGVNVLGFDYRGYGRSEGRPDEEGTYLDAAAAYQWLRDKGFEGENIIAVGESLGAAVAAELATREPLGGLVLQSAFTSVPDIGAELYPWLPVRRITSLKYDTRAKLPGLRVPVLVMHSREDTIVPYHHGQALFEAANEPKLFQELAGDHNDTLLAGRHLYKEGFERLLGGIESGRKP